jgi:hypothetical protein
MLELSYLSLARLDKAKDRKQLNPSGCKISPSTSKTRTTRHPMQRTNEIKHEGYGVYAEDVFAVNSPGARSGSYTNDRNGWRSLLVR